MARSSSSSVWLVVQARACRIRSPSKILSPLKTLSMSRSIRHSAPSGTRILIYKNLFKVVSLSNCPNLRRVTKTRPPSTLFLYFPISTASSREAKLISGLSDFKLCEKINWRRAGLRRIGGRHPTLSRIGIRRFRSISGSGPSTLVPLRITMTPCLSPASEPKTRYYFTRNRGRICYNRFRKTN